MKKYVMIIAVALIATLSLPSCTTKQGCINSLYSLSEDIDRNGDRYSYRDWKNAFDKYENTNKKLMKYDLTPSERYEVGRLQGDCAAKMAKGVATSGYNDVMGIAGQLKGLLDGLKGVFGFGNNDNDN